MKENIYEIIDHLTYSEYISIFLDEYLKSKLFDSKKNYTIQESYDVKEENQINDEDIRWWEDGKLI